MMVIWGKSPVARLDDDEKNTVVLTDGIRGNLQKVIVNEPGLYAIVLSSRKPEAKAFKRWITHEVIPSIRKHGLYAADELLANPTCLSRFCRTSRKNAPAPLSFPYLDETEKQLGGKNYYGE